MLMWVGRTALCLCRKVEVLCSYVHEAAGVEYHLENFCCVEMESA